MFQADLKFRDFGAPYEIVDGALVFGSSIVRPLKHRMIESRVLVSESRAIVIALERSGDAQSASGACDCVQDAEIDAELAALRDYPLDYAIVSIDWRAPRVEYVTSPLVTAPAYIHVRGGSVLIDWDYARLLRGIDVHPSKDIVLAQIAGRSIYDTRTIVEELHRTTADSRMVIRPDGLEAIYPPGIAHDGPQEVVQGVDLEAALFETVSTIVSARPLTRANTAVELSGGMDSALTALAAAEAIGGPLLSVGARFRGDMGQAQDERRRLAIQRAGFDDLVVPAERFPPFAPGTSRRLGRSVLPDDENYPELFEILFAALRAAGTDTLISGFGGDELYTVYEGEEACSTAPESLSPFLSAEGRRRAQAISSRYPEAWLQPSTWQSAAARSQRVLRFGLWPVYPYINIPLARFVSRLPFEHRRDRALLRKTLTRRLGNPVYETDYKKEAFGAVARRGIANNRQYLLEIVRASSLQHFPEIDFASIESALESDIRNLDKPTFESLFRVLKILSFF